MKKERVVFSIIGLGLLGALMWRGESISQRFGHSEPETRKTIGSHAGHIEDSGDENFKTKVGDRPPPSPAATHRPERLKEFILPTLTIEGLGIEEAMQKLKEAYEETCLKTGEIPLNLRFDIPPESSGKINIRLEGKNFSSAVKLLATLSGMTASRHGSLYEFALIPDERDSISRSFTVPPDFYTTVDALGNIRGEKTDNEGDTSPKSTPLNTMLRSLGLDLDPSTHLALGNKGTMILETTSTADATALTQLTKTLANEKPMQLRFSSRLIELPPGVDFPLPDTSKMTGAEAQFFMREMAQRKGTELMTLPSLVTKNGEPGTIELVREYTLPKNNNESEFETHLVGKVMHLEGSALGFGQETAFNFTDTTVDDTTKDITFETQTAVSDNGFTSDQGTRFVVQERPDGTKAVVLVTSTLIDPTGHPIHEGG